MVRAMRAVIGVGAATVLLAVAPSVAQVPPDIAAWFEHEAAPTLIAAARDAVVIDEEFRPPRYEEVTIGRPRPMHTWDPEPLAGDPTPFSALDQWGAPYTGDGQPAGTVVAWYDDGVAAFASADDDVALATALAALPDDAAWVVEPMLGAHFAVVGDEVHTLRMGRQTGDVPVLTLSELREALVAWRAEAARGGVPAPADVPASRWLPLGLAVLAAGVLAGAVAVRRAARRAAGAGVRGRVS